MTARYSHLAPDSHRVAAEAVAQASKTNGNSQVVNLEKNSG
jgi:hypothetical protein